MRAALVVLAAAMLSAAPRVHAWDPIWRGHVGTAEVVVELDAASPEPTGRYFYVRHGEDIELHGKRSGNAIVLHEGAVDVPGNGAAWRLSPTAAGVLDGTWRDARRTLPIHLQRFEPTPADPERADALRENPFGALRIAAYRLTPGRVQTVGAYRLQWYVEPRTGVELFRVETGYGAKAMARVNRLLAQRQWADVARGADCLAVPDHDFEPSTTFHRIDASIISVSLFASYECGGAHPDFGDAPLNIDPRTGRVLELEDVIWLGKGVPPRMEGAGQQAFFDYRDHVFAPWAMRTLAHLHAEEIVAGEDGCDYTEADVWKFPSWYVTDAGVYLGPVFWRALRACDDPGWSVIPWRDVEAHAGAVHLVQ